MERNTQIRNVGASNGNVMLLCICQKLAPSTLAASYSSSGMDCMPASIRITAKPTYFQLISNSSVQIAIFGSASQSGPLMPKLARISLMAPFFCSNRLHPVPTMTSETTYGTKMRVRMRPRPLNFWFSSNANRMASGAWITNEPITTSKVCRIAAWNAGSLSAVM